MSRFSAVVEKFFLPKVPKNLPTAQHLDLDLGSTYTRVMVDGKLLFHEPSCIAYHRESGVVVAVGKAAWEILGKTPPQIVVVQPFREAKIQNLEAAQLFVSSVLAKFTRPHRVWNQVIRPRVRLAVSAFISQIEKEAFKNVLLQSNVIPLNYPNFPTKSRAILKHLGHSLPPDQHLPRILGIVDIGGTTIEVTFFSGGEVVSQKLLRFGGEAFTQMVIECFRKQHHCEVGWQTAEKCKRQVAGIGLTDAPRKQMVVRGRDIFSSLPTTLQVGFADFEIAFQELAQDIELGIQECCQDTPPEIVTEALEHGLYLTGGGSKLRGLAKFLEVRLHAPMIVSATPYSDVVEGLA